MDKVAVRKIKRAGYTIEDAIVRLSAIVQEHLRTTGEPPSAFGERVMGDPSFVAQISNGRQPRLPTIARVLGAIRKERAACRAL